MKKIMTTNKEQIKQLLYSGYVLGIKDDQFRAFGGFQRWLYNKELDECHSCEAHWIDKAKKVKAYSLDKAVKILWRNRDSLFLYTKDIPPTQISKVAPILEGKK